MKKKVISRLLTIAFLLNIYGYKVQAVSNNPLIDKIQNDKSGAKSKIMSNYKKNKFNKNFKEGEIIVKIKTGTSNSSIESTDKKYNIESKEQINKQLDVVKFDKGKYSMDEMLINLNNDSNIEYAEPNYIKKLSSLPEDEPDFSMLWGLKNTTTEGMDINAETAWKTSTGNPNVVVGVIDTGVDYTHEDLKDNIWVNDKEIAGNGVDDDGNGYIDDYNGWNFGDDNNNPYDVMTHGTHVSGTIAASTNGIGSVGVAPNVKVMPLRVANSQGILYTSDVIEAIKYGTLMGVKLFNCSFGGSGFSQAEYDVMKNSNALFMCSAGNGDAYGIGMDNDSSVKNYPASFDLSNIVSVASIDKYGDLSTFSNYGVSSVDIAAPGSYIYSTIPGGYGYMSGTSMATPHVTGVAALVLSVNMDLTPIEVKDCILKSTNKSLQLESKIATGAIVDAFGAMAVAKPSIVVNVTGVELDNSSIDLKTGASKQLTAAITPSNATNKLIKWTSSNSGIATVSSTGKVKAIDVGESMITATTADGNKTSTCNVIVTEPITPAYYIGDKFIVKINTPEVFEDSAYAFMIKPDGTEQYYDLEYNVAEGYYYVDLSVNDDEVIYSNEIDAGKDFGTWEVKSVGIRNGSYTYYYNEKYYSIDTASKKTLNFNASKFTIASPEGIIKDDTKDLSNNSKTTTPGNITLFESIEITKNKVYLGDDFTIKINAKDTSGIDSGIIFFRKPDGTEVSYILSSNPRGGYYYTQLKINNGGTIYYKEIDPVKDYGTWQIEKVLFWDVNGESTYYNYGDSTGDTVDLDAGNFTVNNSLKPIIPTDVDDNGTTDILDLALVGAAYNLHAGNSKYNEVLDINKDGVVDIFDLVMVSKKLSSMEL